jgi:ribosome maturation factor RimP
MINKEIIINKINEGFSGRGFFIVDVVVSPGNKIIISIDTEQGIKINECVEITRYLLNNSGSEIEDYEVQVSSPGLDNDFKVIEQYKKNIGKQIEIVKKNGLKVTGTLIGISDEFIDLAESLKSKRNEEMRVVKVEFSEIKSAKQVIKIN